MRGESEAANLWAALLGLALFTAVTLTAGYWFCVYRQKAAELAPYLVEPCTAFDLMWGELPPPYDGAGS